MGQGRRRRHAPTGEGKVKPSRADSSVGPVAALGRGLIRVWQHTIGPMIPSSCRFLPSCSRYMYQAMGEQGFWRGAWLGLKRLGRCHPWSAAGYDPVPDRKVIGR